MRPGKMNKSFVPFYEPPSRKTSAEIINEARLAIKESQSPENNFASSTIKPLQTQRPFTPRDKERLLFGKKLKNSNRPPSAFSLRYLQTEADLPSTPPDGAVSCTSVSEPLSGFSRHGVAESSDKIFNIGVRESCKIRLPSLESTRPLQKRKTYKSGASLDKLPEEGEHPRVETSDAIGRNAFSSPEVAIASERPLSRVHSTLSECLLLGPKNLEKIFDNRQIIEHSEPLFTQTGYLSSSLRPANARKKQKSVSAVERQSRRVDDVIEDLTRANAHGDCDERVRHLLEELYGRLVTDHSSANARIDSKLKIRVLKCMYKFVESKDEVLLLNIAKVILAIKVTGNNLSGVCKLIFKVSKNDKNDHLFTQKDLLELFVDALGRSSPLDDAEALVYGYGAVKFLTMNPKLLEKILALGILQLMVLHAKIVNNAKMDKTPFPEQTNHALYQLTGAMRNLVSDERIYDDFITSGAITQLCHTLDLFSNDLDIVANISRTLSTISSNDCCCDGLVENGDVYRVFIRLFVKYPRNEEIIVRLTYTLGNIVAKIDNTRVKYFHEENSIESLLELWKTYLERTLQTCSLKMEDETLTVTNTEDVMIKVIRVVANIVINPEVGNETNMKYGNALTDEFLKVLISNPFKKNEELVLSVLSTLNNLSYYYTSDLESDVFHVKQVDIVEAITEYLKSKNKECVIESMRILGNLSRSKITRNYIAETEIFPILIVLLDKADLTLLKTTVGVFVNLMSDNKSRTLFKENRGVEKLITVLAQFCEHDWLLGTLACQALWNYCIDTVDLYELFADKEIQQLLVLLADLLDEEKLFGVDENTEGMDVYVTQEYLIWEEFAGVATNLLEKIEYFLDTFDQLLSEDGKQAVKTKDSSTNISFAAW